MEKHLLFKNTRISFLDYGEGPVVVLLHGFLENKTMWNGLIPEFSKKNRVIAIDLLGHGKTACLGYIHSMEMMSEAVYAILKTLRIRKVTLIGHSMGGYVCLSLAEKHPEMIRGLCLLNSTSLVDDATRKRLRTRGVKMVKNNFSSAVRMSFVNLFREENRTRFKAEIELALTEALKTPLQGYIASQEGMKIRPKRTDVLNQKNFKRLFIVGRKDPILSIKKSLDEAQKTHSEIVVLSGGHMSHIENKIEVISALKKFIKDCLN